MEPFDPIRHIKGSELILDADGSWPDFHDAHVNLLSFWRGDLRPEENIWIGPVIEATIALSPQRAEEVEKPFTFILRFDGCDFVEMSGFNHLNEIIHEIRFSFEERGFFADGVTPLPPYICVRLDSLPGFGVALSFKCFTVEVAKVACFPDNLQLPI